MSLQRNSCAKPSPWQLDNSKASPVREWGASMLALPCLSSQAPESQLRNRQDVLFWKLNCSVPMAGWLSPPYPLPAALLNKGSPKDRAVGLIPPCPLTTTLPTWGKASLECLHHRAAKGGCTYNIHLL